MKAFWGWCLVFAVSSPALGADISFWDTARQGKNISGTTVDLDLLHSLKRDGIRLLRLNPSRWQTHRKDFLLGDAIGFFQLIPRDLIHLFQVVNLCHDQGFRVILTTQTLPGLSPPDSFLWTLPDTLAAAGEFWRQLAVGMKGHPAVVGYDLLDKPNPENVPGASVTVGTFHSRMLEAIRYVDAETPVIVESGQGADPDAFRQMTALSDARVLYSFHHTEGKPISAVVEWQKVHHIPANRILVGETTRPKLIQPQGWHWLSIADKASIVGKN